MEPLFETFNLNNTISSLAGKSDFEAARLLFFKLSFLPVLLILLTISLTVIIIGLSGGFKKKTWWIIIFALLLCVLFYILAVIGILPYYFNFSIPN